MKILIQEWKAHAKDHYEEHLTYLKSLRNQADVDQKAQKLDQEVFEQMDCLDCANCCKSHPPLITSGDIKRIAKHLGMPPKTFKRKYVLEDFNGELSFNYLPCHFLQEDNKCSIYEVRPNACREFPHMGQKGFHKRAKLNAQNTLSCPAAYQVVRRMMNS